MECWYENDIQEIEEGNMIKEYDITSTPNDFNIMTLFNLIDNGIIKMPPFQRNYVWDKKRASKLIESIILGLPIPQVFLYEKGKNNFYVIDGQQRLLSIYFFIKQRFPKPSGKIALRQFLTGEEGINPSLLSNDDFFTNFSLSLRSSVPSAKNKYHNLKHETLGDLKHTFDYLRTIRSVVVKQNEPDDDSSMYEIFNRLNSGGLNLSSQEIRMSIFYSDFYKMLIRINHNKKWREILGQKELDLRFRDVEILLRAFSMLFLHDDYQASMTSFLNRFSKIGSKFDDIMLDYLSNLFESFINSCNRLSFMDFNSSKGRFNNSLFVSVFVASTEPSFKGKSLIKKSIDPNSIHVLKNDDDFSRASQDSIASKKNVSIRLDRAKKLIKLF